MPELSTIEVGICTYFEKDRPYGSDRTHCTKGSTELLVISFPLRILFTVISRGTLNAGGNFYTVFSSILSMAHILQKYCRWTFPVKRRIFFTHTHACMLTACSEQDTKIQWGNFPRPSPDKRRLALGT